MSSLDEDPLKSSKTQDSHASKRLQQAQIGGFQKMQQALSDVHETHKTIVQELEAQITRLEVANSELKTHHELRAQRAKLEEEVIDLKNKVYRVRLCNLLDFEKGDKDDTAFEPQLAWLLTQNFGADCVLDADMMLDWGGIQGESCEHVRDSFVNLYGMTPQQIRNLAGHGSLSEQIFEVVDHRANKSLDREMLNDRQRHVFENLLCHIESGDAHWLLPGLCTAYWGTDVSKKNAGRKAAGKESG